MFAHVHQEVFTVNGFVVADYAGELADRGRVVVLLVDVLVQVDQFGELHCAVVAGEEFVFSAEVSCRVFLLHFLIRINDVDIHLFAGRWQSDRDRCHD